jgi:predicted nucleic acid-binding protein
MPDRPPAEWLVDTNVLSNKTDADDSRHVAEWLRFYAGKIRISVITIAEMRRGLALLERKVQQISDVKVRNREELRLAHKREWYAAVIDRFADRIVPIDVAVAEQWAEISVRFPALRDGDKAIAATAIAKGYGVATRNLGDFRASAIALVNPFDPGTWEEIDDDPIRLLLDP